MNLSQVEVEITMLEKQLEHLRFIRDGLIKKQERQKNNKYAKKS